MTIHLGDIPAGSTLYLPFTSYNAAGASVTLTGLAVTDIEIYKNGSTTQRASDAGYTLLDTDGIDFDGITGLHGFSVDLADNTDAGFFSVGAFYWVVVSTVTIDSQTVTFIPATFRIVAAESSAGVPKVDLSHIAGSAVSTSTAQLGVNVVQAAGTAWNSGAIGATTLAADTITAAKVADGTIDAATFAANAITATVIAANAITAAKVATDAIGAAQLAADAVTEIQSGLATSASIAALNNISAAQVNAEVVDALNVDTYAEPGQGNPAATTTLTQKIGYLYKAWRNRTTQTATEYALYNDDATTKAQEADVSDNGTTFERGEVRTGA